MIIISVQLQKIFATENNCNYNCYKFLLTTFLFLFCPFIELNTRMTFLASSWSPNKRYFCFFFTAISGFKVILNSPDFYKGVFLNVIPVPIIFSFESSQFQKLFLNQSNINNKYS